MLPPLLLACIIVIVNYKPQQRAEVLIPTEIASLGSRTLPVNEETGWKTYSNSKYGFSFTYPSNWYLEGHDDADIISNYKESSNYKSQYGAEGKFITVKFTEEPAGEHSALIALDGKGHKIAISPGSSSQDINGLLEKII